MRNSPDSGGFGEPVTVVDVVEDVPLDIQPDVVILPPHVTSTWPIDLAMDVSNGVWVTATFDKPMNPATISNLTFTLSQDLTPVTGTVTFDELTNTATFKPDMPLVVGLAYQATVTVGVKDAGNVPMEADYGWSFIVIDTFPPMVVFTTPQLYSVEVPITTHLTATFTEPMDPLTINELTFTLKQGLTPVTGTVTYDALTYTATFVPDAPLGLNLPYDATITTGAKDVAGNALGGGYGWNFTTSECGMTPIVLAASNGYAILAGSTVTNTGPSIVTGDLGVFAGTAVTGFPPGTVIGAIHAGDTVAELAIASLTVAYNEAAGRSLCAVTVSGNLGGSTFFPGLYKSTSSLEISSGDVYLDAQGDSSSVFIFQMASTFTTTAGRQVFLTGGAKASNVFWQVGTSATIGSTSAMFGTIMADQSITMVTGASLTGRLLARIGAVTLDSNIIVLPAL